MVYIDDYVPLTLLEKASVVRYSISLEVADSPLWVFSIEKTRVSQIVLKKYGSQPKNDLVQQKLQYRQKIPILRNRKKLIGCYVQQI